MQSAFCTIVCYSNSTWHVRISYTFRALCAIMLLAANIDYVQPYMQITFNWQKNEKCTSLMPHIASTMLNSRIRCGY